jgi:alpha-galactosidase
VLTNIDINANLAPYAGPGAWNDPCLLLAETYSGTLRQTMTQTRTQFSMWAVMASPLLISANVRQMSAYNLETYTNKEVIAVNQVFVAPQTSRCLRKR